MKKYIGWGIVLSLSLVGIIVVSVYLYSRQTVPQTHVVENLAATQWTHIFGIDVSHYQGVIDWQELNTSQHQINYIFIRATMGKNGRDLTFLRNWENAKRHNYIRGAYHYYRPNENSTKQFNNYKAVVQLERGDFIPILDIEKESIYGRDNLRKGVLNWLALAEEEYGVKPMVYTGLHFYEHVLRGYIEGYPLWIAAYSGRHRITHIDWRFHQFTEKVKVKGISTMVDGNDFNGSSSLMRSMLIP